MNARNAVDYQRQLALLLRRQLALTKDSLMNEAQDLLEEHFASIGNDNILKGSQLKNIEGVAFTSLAPSEVINFIRHQASKDQNQNAAKPAKQKWICNELDKKLIAQLTQIVGRTAGKTSGESGHKDAVLTRVREKTGSGIPAAFVDAWLNAEREQEIQMELLREFVSYFTVLYANKAAEHGTGPSEEEGE